MWKPKRGIKAHVTAVSTPKEVVIDTPKTQKFSHKVCICGTVRDGEEHFSKVISNLNKIGSYFTEYVIIISESDSNDNTVKLYSSLPNIKFISLGNLQAEHPERTDRIAISRNAYLNIVRNEYKHFDLMMVIDLDDVITEELDYTVFNNALNEGVYQTWDVVFANQSYRYYDIWALRNSEVNYDCWKEINAGKMTKIDAILKHQYHIPKNSPMIPVTSAFGGLGIYKISMIDETTQYSNIDDNHICCEHVPLNKQIISKGGKLFIDPSLVLETPLSFAKYYTG